MPPHAVFASVPVERLLAASLTQALQVFVLNGEACPLLNAGLTKRGTMQTAVSKAYGERQQAAALRNFWFYPYDTVAFSGSHIIRCKLSQNDILLFGIKGNFLFSLMLI